MAKQFDAFISHCGKDCKQDFAVILKRDLERAGICCFLDERDLQLGDQAAREMLNAMNTSQFGIVILSRGFFSREWCMKELQTFVQRKNLLPVFLGISPDDLKGILEEGPPVWEGFERFPFTKEEYADAVLAALEFTGQRVEVGPGFWDTCLERLKTALLRLLGKHEGGVRLSEARLVVGVTEHVARLKELLGLLPASGEGGDNDNVGQEGQSSPGELRRRKLSEARAGKRPLPDGDGPGESKKWEGTESWEVSIVGVNGMGGVGKTTLAKLIYDDPDVRRFFGWRVCWVEVNQAPKEDQICRLQEQILHELCSVEVKVFNPTKGRAEIRNHLGRAKVLVILDNVWDDYGSNGVVTSQCLGSGSRILKTTRDVETIGDGGMKYDLNVLGDGAAWELFCSHAFSGKAPPTRLTSSAQQVVKSCGGLPLALELVGSRIARELHGLLCDANIDNRWAKLLSDCKRVGTITVGRRSSVLDILRLSYDALPTQALKDAFILLAGLWHNLNGFRGREQVFPKLAAAVYGTLRNQNLQEADRLAHRAVEELEQRSLIRIIANSFQIHDLLLELGRALAHKEAESTGLQSQRFCRLVGNRQCLKTPMLAEHLVVSADRLGSDDLASLFNFAKQVKSVVILKVPRYCFKFAPSLADCQLLIFEGQEPKLYPRMKEEDAATDLTFDLSGIPNLRYLKLTVPHGLASPPVLTGLVNLHHLDLSESRLWEPPVLGGLVNLRHLNLTRCCLHRLPDFSGLRALQHLELGSNPSVAPPNLAGLKNVLYLGLADCDFEAPPILVGLVKLQVLDLSGCGNLATPPQVGHLKSLRHLKLRCSGIREPPVLEGLTSLRTLDMSRCVELEEPPELVGLDCLEKVTLDTCPSLKSYPDTSKLPATCQYVGLGLHARRNIPLLDTEFGKLWWRTKPEDIYKRMPSMPKTSSLYYAAR